MSPKAVLIPEGGFRHSPASLPPGDNPSRGMQVEDVTTTGDTQWRTSNAPTAQTPAALSATPVTRAGPDGRYRGANQPLACRGESSRTGLIPSGGGHFLYPPTGEKSVMAETWITVAGFPRYEVSDRGNVRRSDGKVLNPELGTDNRLRVRIAGIRKSVHSLVAEAFIGPRPKGFECLHRDGNPHNNTVFNLRWGTRSENQLDSVRHGTHAQARKTHCPHGHEYVPENLVRNKLPRRECLTCERERNRSRRRQARLEKATTLA